MVIIGSIAGLILSLIGGGGALIGTPLLIYTAHMQIHDAILTSLLSGVVTCSLYLYKNLKHKLILWNYAIPIATIGVVVAPIGANSSFYLDKKSLSLVYGTLMLVSSYLMWKNAKKLEFPESEIKAVRPYKYFIMIIVAIISSFIGGMTGGGGIIIVPFLVLFMNTSMKSAAATSIFLILVFTSVSSATHLVLNENFIFHNAIFYSIGCVSGMLYGYKLFNTISDKILKQVFSIIVSMTGVAMVIHNLITQN